MSQSQASSADLARLNAIGKLLDSGVAEMAAAAIFYGIFLILFSVSIVTFILRKSRTFASYLIISTTILTFLIATLDLAARIADIYITTAMTLRDERADVSLSQKMSLANKKLVYPNIIGEWTRTSAALIADLIVIWRLWTVIPEQRYRATILPVVLFVSSLGVALVYLVKISTPQGIFALYNGGAPYAFFSATLILSLVTNGLTTIIFGLKLWRFRRFLAQNGVSSAVDISGTRKQLERIFLLIIESGLFYCTIQFVYLVWGFVGSKTSSSFFVQKIYNVFYVSMSFIYPTLVVVLVNTQRSLADNVHETGRMAQSTEHREITENHLSFAVVHSESRDSQVSDRPVILPKESIGEMKALNTSTKSSPV